MNSRIKLLRTPAFLLICILNISQLQANDPIIVSADFDHASIDTLVEIAPNYLKGNPKHWLKADGIGDQCYWFYVKLENVQGDTVTIELNNLKGVYRGNTHLIYTGYTQPVFSYDQKEWERITDVQYDGSEYTLTFSRFFEQNEVWIAYAHPYPYEQVLAFIESIITNPLVSVETIGQSVEGRDIDLITIEKADVPADNKKTVLTMALQHPGEDAGGYFTEGMIRQLLSEDAAADTLLSKYIFKFIPVMNPDGLVNGTTRYNMNMEDLNSEWDDHSEDTQNAPVEPEVLCVQNWIRDWYADGNKIDLFTDLHCHGQKEQYMLFFGVTTNQKFDSLCEKHWDFPVRYTVSNKFGRARSFLYHEFDLQESFVLEISQSRVSTKADYLTIADYLSMGRNYIMAIDGYFYPKETSSAGNGFSVDQAPGKYNLFHNYPNPFNSQTVIKFSLSQRKRVNMNIYNSNGQHIRTLLNEEKPAGMHVTMWNGLDDLGNSVTSGLYFYRMQSGDFEQTNKLLLLE